RPKLSPRLEPRERHIRLRSEMHARDPGQSAHPHINPSRTEPVLRRRTDDLRQPVTIEVDERHRRTERLALNQLTVEQRVRLHGVLARETRSAEEQIRAA